MSGRLGLKD
ncbi:hypothetical protein E2C01_052572 [Portunus trituberculatus]|uniref:Uncharacterized protein n=1 Tax=Portunus trituberculatus TaxID=210409 RepID=A0A5B7GM87_PORTR|nr:hypothetical protein [Portunus trituberculatus]